MSVCYSQIWTVADMRSVVRGELTLMDLMTQTLIKDSKADNYGVVKVIGGVGAGVIFLVNKYLFFDPEKAAGKILRFLTSKNIYYVVGASAGTYIVLKFSEVTNEQLTKVADELEQGGYAGIIMTIEFTVPNEWSDITNYINISFTPLQGSFKERY